MRKIYGIVDNIARDLAGPITTHRHDAAAVRMFDDIARTPQTMVNRHPEHYTLIAMGSIDELTHEITPLKEIILEGSAWATVNQQTTEDKQ